MDDNANRVYVARYDSGDQDETRVYRFLELANHWRDEIVRENWPKYMADRMPDNPGVAAVVYFERMPAGH